MIELDPAELARSERHRLLIGSVVPRPIAWITSGGGTSSGADPRPLNLAPFSYFMGVSADPLTVAVSIGGREPPKDTLANLRATREAVVHLASPGQVEIVNQSGAEYATRVSEVEALGLATAPSKKVSVPRLTQVPVALEARLHDEVKVGSASLCILEIVHAWLDEAITRADGLPDPEKLCTPARLGETYYLAPDRWDVRSMDRPKPPPGAERA